MLKKNSGASQWSCRISISNKPSTSLNLETKNIHCVYKYTWMCLYMYIHIYLYTVHNMNTGSLVNSKSGSNDLCNPMKTKLALLITGSLNKWNSKNIFTRNGVNKLKPTTAHTHTHTHIYIYIYIKRGGRKRQTHICAHMYPCTCRPLKACKYV